MPHECDPNLNVPNQVLRLNALTPRNLQPYTKGVDLRLTGRLFLQLEDALYRFEREEKQYYKFTELINGVRTLLHRVRQLIKHCHLFQIGEKAIKVLPGSVEIVIQPKLARAGLKACTEIRDLGWIRGDMLDELIRRFEILNIECQRIENRRLDNDALTLQL